jgi:hypothetical protein
MSARQMLAAAAAAFAVAVMSASAPAASAAGGQKLAPAASPSARKAPHLTSRHSGWRKTQCAECHDPAGLAAHHAKAQELRAPDCGRCHGFNGAPHEGHAAVNTNPCRNCHGTTAHLASFQLPDDCMKCHVHPNSPQGR